MSADEGGESADDEKTRVLSVVAEEGVHYDERRRSLYQRLKCNVVQINFETKNNATRVRLLQ